MFSAGDQVVYPLYGAALVQAVEHRALDGSSRDYYDLQLLLSHMTVSLPVANVEAVGLRPLSSPQQLEQVKAVLQQAPAKLSYKDVAWNKRQQLYMQLLKQGDLEQVAHLYRLFKFLEAGKRLSVGEKRLLNITKTIMVSEIMLILQLTKEETEAWLEQQLQPLQVE